MDKVYKHALWCNTDSKWEYTITESETHPTVCPTDSAHTLDTNKSSIKNTLFKEEFKMEAQVSSDGASTIFEGFQFVATNSVTTTYDFKFANNFLLNKGELEAITNHHNDKIDTQIVDVDNILGYGAGTVLKTYILNYPIRKEGLTPFITEKKTSTNLKDLYMRVKYTSVGTVDVDVNVRMRGFDS